MSGKMVWWSTEPNWSTKLGDLLECLKLTLGQSVSSFWRLGLSEELSSPYLHMVLGHQNVVRDDRAASADRFRHQDHGRAGARAMAMVA